jgi:TetR/AcrR family transcriptional regulator
VHNYLETMLEELMGSMLLLEEKSLSPDLLTQVIRRRDRTERALRRILEEGMRTGEFRKADPKLIVFAILGAINWVPKWYDPAGERSASEIARQFADYLVAGLLGDGSRSPGSGIRNG